MKRIFFISGILILKSILLQAQEYSYVPLPDSNAIWSEIYFPPWESEESITNYKYAVFNEDTIIDEKTYHKLFILNDTVLNRENAIYMGAIREDGTKKVYYRGDHIFLVDPLYSPEEEEIQVYDFSVDIGDTIRNAIFTLSEHFLVVSDIDTIIINNTCRKRFHFLLYGIIPHYIKWVEGIGNMNGLLFYSGSVWSDGTDNDLVCLFQNDTLVYHYSEYNECFYTLTNVIETKEDYKIIIFPNPIQEIGVMFLNNSYCYLEIYSIIGKRIKTYNVEDLEEITLKRSDFQSGLYLFKLIGNNKKTCRGKLIFK